MPRLHALRQQLRHEKQQQQQQQQQQKQQSSDIQLQLAPTTEPTIDYSKKILTIIY
jgi:hypothetical protein